MSHRFEVIPVHGLPEIAAGDRLGELIAGGLADAGVEPAAGDVVAVAHKAVSKAEGRVRELGDVAPGPEARRLAERLGKDPRLVELIRARAAPVRPRRARPRDRGDTQRLDLRHAGTTPPTCPAPIGSPCCLRTPMPARGASGPRSMRRPVCSRAW